VSRAALPAAPLLSKVPSMSKRQITTRAIIEAGGPMGIPGPAGAAAARGESTCRLALRRATIFAPVCQAVEPCASALVGRGNVNAVDVLTMAVEAGPINPLSGEPEAPPAGAYRGFDRPRPEAREDDLARRTPRLMVAAGAYGPDAPEFIQQNARGLLNRPLAAPEEQAEPVEADPEAVRLQELVNDDDEPP